jgi:DNA-binding NtrC family response regulator
MGESATAEEVPEKGRIRAGVHAEPAHLFRLIECERPLALPARACLRAVDEVIFGRRVEQSTAVDGRTLTLGLTDRFLSSKHASLRRTEAGWLLTDQGSKNGTLVNGARVEQRLLADHDLVEVGHTLLLFREALPAPPGAPVHLEASALGAREPGLLTLDPMLEKALERLRAVAPSKLSVVIAGETGTGKELAASALHALSGRGGAFIAVNCAAIPPTLLEAQLFGHKKGAFSGALEDAQGLIRASDRGTLFLDEVGELPLLAQAALLRALAQGQVLPVGATQPVSVDLRVVCATNRHLGTMVAAGTFRADLLSRLQGLSLELPPLRERLPDLGLLVSQLLQRHAKAPSTVTLEPQAARALARWRWPLNIRELEQALAAALLLAGEQPIGLEHLPAELRGEGRQLTAPEALPEADQELRARLVVLLIEHGGNLSAVARVLGKGRTQIARWVQRYGIDPAQPR